MDRFIFFCFCFLLFWAPIPLGSNRDWSATLLAVLVTMVFSLWLLTPKESMPRAFNNNKKVIYVFFLIPLWSAIQLIPLPVELIQYISPQITIYDSSQTWQTLSLDIKATVYQLQKSITYAIFFVLALAIINTPRRLEIIAQLVVVTGVIQACYGVLVTIGGKGFDILHIKNLYSHQHSATGTFTNHNHFAGYLEMCLAIGIGLLIQHILNNKNKFSGWRAMTREFLISLFSGKARLRIFLALMVVAMVLSHSRMGNGAFFASLGISGGLGLMLYRKNKNAKSMIILFSSLIFIDLCILSSWFGLEKLADRLESTSSEAEGRTYVFTQSLFAIKDFWLSGTGAGSFYSIFPHYRNNQIYHFFDYTHNDFFQFTIEYGVIGITMFATIAIYCFTRSIQAQIYRQTAILKGMGFASMMGIMSLMIHSAVDYNLQIPSNAMLFTLLCAFACIAYSMEYQEHNNKRRRSHSAD